MSVIGRVRLRALLARAVLACLALGVAACGSAADSEGRTVVDWFVVPDRGDQAALADMCARGSGGAYTVTLHQQPANIDDRHTELVRRLSGASASIDVVSLDTSLIPEMSAAGFLAPFSAAQKQAWGGGVAPGALAASTDAGALVAAPWWFDPQLLWFRGATAERAGLDITAPVTWDDVLTGAGRLGVPVQIDDVDGTGTSEWVAGLIAAGGGSLVTGGASSTTVSLDSAAARGAASVMELYRESRVGPGPASDAVDRFAGPAGGFLIAPSSAVSAASMQVVAPELGITAYPAISGAVPAPAPAAGISLAVPRGAGDQAASADLITCLTAPEQQRSWVLATGHGAARTATYDDETLQRDSPTAAAVQQALLTARPVPSTPYWTAIRRAIDSTWQPLSGVAAATTPKESQRHAAAAVAGELP